MNLEEITLLFLVVVFVSAEVRRIMRSRRGMIVGIDESSILPNPALVIKALVRLEDGREVSADLNPCTACLGRLDIGDEIGVRSTRDGWVADLPWWKRYRCSAANATQECRACSDPR